MQPKHFIEILIDLAESGFEAALSGSAKADELERAVAAADQIARNDWHGQGERASALAAAIIKRAHGPGAREAARSFSAGVRLHIDDAEEPQTRSQSHQAVVDARSEN